MSTLRSTFPRPPLRQLTLVVLIGLVLATAGTLTRAAEARQHDLAAVRASVAVYHNIDRAVADGWSLVEGLDHCFSNPATGEAMGYHLIDTSRLDTVLDPLLPEALVYKPMPNGSWRLGAVEYIVPVDAWAAEGHSSPPSVLGHELHVNEALGVWVLHAWLFEPNSNGTFEDWNPRVSCS